MPDLSGPFDGATFGQAPWYRDAGPTTRSGVVGDPAASAAAGDLGLTAAGFALSLSLGRARVRGAAYERTGSAWTDTVPANTSSIGGRNDLIVLRRNLVTKTVAPMRLTGAAQVTPTDPIIQQNEDGSWDEVLHRILVPPNSGTPLVITDRRRWLGSGQRQLLEVPRLHASSISLQTGQTVTAGGSGFPISDVLTIPEHRAGPLHLAGTVMLAGAGVNAGYAQLAVGFNLGALTLIGAQQRWHNGGAPGWSVPCEGYYDSDGRQRIAVFLGWNDAGSANTISSNAASLRAYQL